MHVLFVYISIYTHIDRARYLCVYKPRNIYIYIYIRRPSRPRHFPGHQSRASNLYRNQGLAGTMVGSGAPCLQLGCVMPKFACLVVAKVVCYIHFTNSLNSLTEWGVVFGMVALPLVGRVPGRAGPSAVRHRSDSLIDVVLLYDIGLALLVHVVRP